MCVCARTLSRQLIRGGSAPSQKWMLLTRKKTSSRPFAVSGTSDGLNEEQLGSSGRPPSHSSASEAPTDWAGREDRAEAAAKEARHTTTTRLALWLGLRAVVAMFLGR